MRFIKYSLHHGLIVDFNLSKEKKLEEYYYELSEWVPRKVMDS